MEITDSNTYSTVTNSTATTTFEYDPHASVIQDFCDTMEVTISVTPGGPQEAMLKRWPDVFMEVPK